MTTPLWCLFGFVAWTVVLVLLIVSWRGLDVLLGKKRINDFPGGVEHGSATYWRLYRAHANCVENLPLFAVVVLTATLLKVEASALATLAMVYLGARLLHTFFHVISGSQLAVAVRFVFFFIQMVCLVAMAHTVIRQAGDASLDDTPPAELKL